MAISNGFDTLVRTIERAIEQAHEIGLPLAVHLLMIARLEVDQARPQRAESRDEPS